MSLITRYRKAKALSEENTLEQLEDKFVALRRLPNVWWALLGAMCIAQAVSIFMLARGGEQPLYVRIIGHFGILVSAGSVLAGMLFAHHRERAVTALALSIRRDRNRDDRDRQHAVLALQHTHADAPAAPAPPRLGPPPLPGYDPEVGGPCSTWVADEPVPPKERMH